MNPPSEHEHLDTAISAALHLLDTGDGTSVQVLSSVRPTNEQLKRVRESCERQGCSLTVPGAEGIEVRRMVDDETTDHAFRAKPEIVQVWRDRLGHLFEMREGVR